MKTLIIALIFLFGTSLVIFSVLNPELVGLGFWALVVMWVFIHAWGK